MSRSKRKTPIIGNTCGGVNRSEKKDKRRANRRLRRKVKADVEGEETTTARDVSDVWDFAKDGKHYFGGGEFEKKGLRK